MAAQGYFPVFQVGAGPVAILDFHRALLLCFRIFGNSALSYQLIRRRQTVWLTVTYGFQGRRDARITKRGWRVPINLIKIPTCRWSQNGEHVRNNRSSSAYAVRLL